MKIGTIQREMGLHTILTTLVWICLFFDENSQYTSTVLSNLKTPRGQCVVWVWMGGLETGSGKGTRVIVVVSASHSVLLTHSSMTRILEMIGVPSRDDFRTPHVPSTNSGIPWYPEMTYVSPSFSFRQGRRRPTAVEDSGRQYVSLWES